MVFHALHYAILVLPRWADESGLQRYSGQRESSSRLSENAFIQGKLHATSWTKGAAAVLCRTSSVKMPHLHKGFPNLRPLRGGWQWSWGGGEHRRWTISPCVSEEHYGPNWKGQLWIKCNHSSGFLIKMALMPTLINFAIHGA